ncbi:MAG: UpxY family transcription antiterminator [Muricauda sp. TMED12]|nr:MAG: UpxY family transcription antiterminator [Muricauda sp. TMED12]
MNKAYSGWHVLYVRSQHEKKVNLLLENEGLNSFLPITTEIRQWVDRKKKIKKPLFPSYVFVSISSKMEFHKALNIKGVINYVKFGNNYAKVQEYEIFRIKQLLDLDSITEIGIVDSIPKIGEKMMINYGPLDGMPCIVTRVGNRGKVYVEIESLKQNITANLPISYLIPLRIFKGA